MIRNKIDKPEDGDFSCGFCAEYLPRHANGIYKPPCRNCILPQLIQVLKRRGK